MTNEERVKEVEDQVTDCADKIRMFMKPHLFKSQYAEYQLRIEIVAAMMTYSEALDKWRKRTNP